MAILVHISADVRKALIDHPTKNALIYMLKKKSTKKKAPKPKKVTKAKPKPVKMPKPAKTAKATNEPKNQKFFRTGEKCPYSGLWTHFCKEKGEKSTIPLSKSETFPPCRTCGSVKWTLVMAA